jgi:hypothetical protein
MTQRKFPSDLQYRVRRYFKHYFTLKSALDERTILKDLSSHLRNEVCLHLLDDALHGIPLFQILQLEELSTLIGILKPFALNRSDHITHAGEVTSEMYILRSGRLAAISGAGRVLRILRPGAYFGELAALSINPIMAFSVQAVSYSE